MRRAAELAASLSKAPFAPERVWRAAAKKIRGRRVVVVGAGDEARAKVRTQGPRAVLVAADGATTAVLEARRRPDVIVTDLDGDVQDEVRAAGEGALVLIHAHGDNGPAVKKWLPRFPPETVAGTCQCRPIPPLRNHGGFTDGDRACFIAAALGATKLRLVGFDFSGKVGRYTGTFDPATKPRKLLWARRLLSVLDPDGSFIESV